MESQFLTKCLHRSSPDTNLHLFNCQPTRPSLPHWGCGQLKQHCVLYAGQAQKTQPLWTINTNDNHILKKIQKKINSCFSNYCCHLFVLRRKNLESSKRFCRRVFRKKCEHISKKNFLKFFCRPWFEFLFSKKA